MAAICPNKSHPDWKDAVTLFGTEETLWIYDQLGGRIPSQTEIRALDRGEKLSPVHNQRVWDVNKAEDLIEGWRTEDGRPVPIMNTFSAKKVDDRILELRKKYYKDKYLFQRGTGIQVNNYWRYPITVIDRTFVTEDLAELHIVRNQERADIEAEQAAREAEANGTPEESRVIEGVVTEPETKEGLKAKIDILCKAIPQITTVYYDPNMDSIAVLEAGGKSIRINPNLMTTDSIGHEFGHALIDMLGGMTNSMIRQGREQLRGTEVEKAVMSKYPDLVLRNDERIDKEILATAIGLKSAELFKEEEQQNKWMRWVIRFFRRLRALLGIESSVVLDLTQRLVAGKQLQTKERATTQEIKEGLYQKGSASLYEQHSKRLEGTRTLIDQLLIEEEKFQSKAALVLQKKLDVLSKKGSNTEERAKLEETLPRLQGANPTKSLLHMARFAVESTREMNDKYLSFLHQERFPSEGTGQHEKLTAKLLSEWRTSVAAWDMLEDLRTLYSDVRSQVDAYGEEVDKKALRQLLIDNKALIKISLGEDKFNTLIKNKDNNILDLLIVILDEAIDIKNRVQKIYIEKGKELMVDFLFPYVNHVKVQKRTEYEQEWLKLDEAKQAETPKSKYILQRMEEERDKIEKETRDLILIELGKAEGDVGFLTRYLDTILDSRDVISSALARTVYDIQEKTNREAVAWKYKFIDKLKPLEQMLGRTPSMPDEVFWDWILETDPDTKQLMQTIISELPSKLIADFEAYQEQVWSDKYRKNNGEKATNTEKSSYIRKWREDAAPRNRELWLEAQREAAAELRKLKLITEKEEKRFNNNIKVRYSASRQPLTKIFKNTEAVDSMQSFYDRNQWTYRTPSDYYKRLNTKWYEFEKIRAAGLKNGVQTDPRVLFYDFLQETIDEAAVRLPGKYALTVELPSMMKGFGQRYRSTAKFGLSKADFLKEELSAKFQKKTTDLDKGLLEGQGEDLNAVGKEERERLEKEGPSTEKVELVNEAGEPVHFLPIYYTQNKNRDRGKWLSLNDQSFDVASLYFNYLKMAIDFGNKYQILAELEMTNYFINNREVIRRDGKNNIIVDATAKKLTSMGESLRDKALTKSGKNSLLAAQVDDFMKSIIYGMEKDEEPDLSIFGYTVDQAKLLDSLNSFTALNLLGVNFVAGLANLNLGEITQVTEAFAGQYATLKDLKDATGYYYKNLGGMMKDIGTRRPFNIVSLLNDRFNTLNEEIEGKINLNSRFANLMKTNTLFFTSHAGEHYMQTRFMLAMLKHLRAVDKEGNDIGDMLSKISVDEETGTLKIDPEVANFGEAEQTSFSAKMHRVLSSMHGEYTEMGQAAIQRKAIGRMGILFRRFVVPGFKRRWERKGINNLLEEETEGYYITFGRLVKQYMTDLKAFKQEMIEREGEAMSPHGRKLTTMERANMRRLAGEMTALGIMIILSAMAMRAKGQDDDKDNWLLNNAAYQILRLRSELMFFVNPSATMQILRSPMASISLFENTFKLIGQLFYPIYSGTLEFQEYQQGAWKGHLKLEKTVSNLIPVYKQIYRIRDIGDQLSWFNQ